MTAASSGAGPCPRRRTITVREEEYSVPCGSRYCVSCGLRWQGDQRVVAVAASEHVGTAAALVTVTAPGDAVLNDLAASNRLRRRECDALWNHTARVRWRALHRRAAGRAARFARRRGIAWRVLFRSWEYQKRGLLHLHLVVPCSSLGQLWATRLYVNALHELGPDYGFGYVLGGRSGDRPRADRPPALSLADGPAAARYVCKYVASVGAGKEGMVAVARRTAQRGSVLYVSRTLTRATGATMSSLRARRRIWSRYPWARSSPALWRAARHLDAAQRGRPPIPPDEAERVGRLVADAAEIVWTDWTGEEQTGATAAPPPGHAYGPEPPVGRLTGRLVLSLAPVLLGVSDPVSGSPWRTSVEVC